MELIEDKEDGIYLWDKKNKVSMSVDDLHRGKLELSVCFGENCSFSIGDIYKLLNAQIDGYKSWSSERNTDYLAELYQDAAGLHKTGMLLAALAEKTKLRAFQLSQSSLLKTEDWEEESRELEDS